MKTITYINIVNIPQISEVLSGIGADSNKTKGIANNLEEVVNGEMGNSPTSNQTLKTGNLNASVDAVNQLSIFHELYQELPSNDELEVKHYEKKR